MKKNKKTVIAVAIVLLISAVIIGSLLLSGPRMRSQPSLRAFEATVNLPPEKSVFYEPEYFKEDEMSFPIENEENIEKGRIYYGYYCVFCHGVTGNGEGPVGESYVPKPADLERDTLGNYSNDELYNLSFTGTGHSPVLERVVPADYRRFILLYISTGLPSQ